MRKASLRTCALVILAMSWCGCRQPTNEEKFKAAADRVRSGEIFAIDARGFTLEKDDDFAALDGATALEKLNLDKCLLTDAAMVHIEGLSHLKELSLSRARISGRGLAAVANLPLEFLRLDETRIGDKGLEEIKRMATLKVLSLWRTNVGDAGLVHLAALPNVKRLSLDETRVTDAGIQKLAAAKSLKVLRVWNTKVTEAGAKKLEKALPGLKVERE